MAYTALARRWRPKSFAEMTGQEHVLRALGNALASGRVHHAFLFTGTRGVGKTTVARILAKCLNCERGMAAEPCGECGSCREIDAGRSVDLIEVDAASRTKVDDTRELLDNVQYAPTRSRYKIYLIDEVHMLSAHSFNALLKTLEEPPPHVKFLLATTDPQKLPVTVLSRCLQFNLKRLSLGLIVARLQHILAAEGVAAEPAALQLLAQAADGSLRDALSLLDQLLAFGNGAVREADTRAMLGTVARDHVERLARLLAAGAPGPLFDCERDLEALGPDYGDLLDQFAGLLERVALRQVVPGYEGDELYAPELLTELAGAYSAEDLQLYYQTVILGRRDLALAPEPRTGFRMTLIRMLAFRPAGAAGEAPAPATQGSATRVPGARGGTVAAASPAAAPAAAAASPAPAVASPGMAPADWPALVARLEIDPPTRMLALHCALLASEGDLLRLALDPRQVSARTRGREEKLTQALTRELGAAVRIAIEVGAASVETPAQAGERASQEAQAEARVQLQADPTVQSLQQRFGATIHPDSVRPLAPG
jgi:DNA polymerase-3 subunit gamma/tau